MAILLKNNIVFLHIPKTGGSWVIKTVKNLGFYMMDLGMEHSDYERIVNYSGHYLGGYLKKSFKLRRPLDNYLKSCKCFCFVREPISFYESLWRFYIDSDWTESRAKLLATKKGSRIGLKADAWHPWDLFENWGDINFSAFITRMIDEYPGYLSNIYERYVPFGSNVIVGKQENLQNDFISLMNRFYGRSFSNNQLLSTKINVSKIEKSIWQPSLKKELVRLEYVAYRRFNYSIPNDF